MTDDAARAERIRANMAAGVAVAVRVAGSKLPRWEALGVCTDDLLNLAGAVAHLDTTAACAAELLADIQHLNLTGRASLARIALAGLLEQAGYVRFVQPEEPAHGEVEV